MSVNLHVTLPQLAIFSAKLTTGHLGKLEIKTKNSESHIAQSFATFQRGVAGRRGCIWQICIHTPQTLRLRQGRSLGGGRKSQSLFTQMILHFLFAPLLLAKFFGQRTSIKTNIVPGSLLEFSAPQKTFRWQVARVPLHHPPPSLP